MKRALRILGVVFFAAVLLTLTQGATLVNRFDGVDCDFVCAHADCSYVEAVEGVEGIAEVPCTIENCECGWDEGDLSVVGECEYVEGVDAIDGIEGVDCDAVCDHADCTYRPSSVDVHAGTFKDIGDAESAFFKGVFTEPSAWLGTVIFWKYVALITALLIVGGLGAVTIGRKLAKQERVPKTRKKPRAVKIKASEPKTPNETRMSNPRQFKRVDPNKKDE